ncbi:hypothetical protein B0H16DRAFT_1681697, partial [Mycena metata]
MNDRKFLDVLILLALFFSAETEDASVLSSSPNSKTTAIMSSCQAHTSNLNVVGRFYLRCLSVALLRGVATTTRWHRASIQMINISNPAGRYWQLYNYGAWQGWCRPCMFSAVRSPLLLILATSISTVLIQCTLCRYLGAYNTTSGAFVGAVVNSEQALLTFCMHLSEFSGAHLSPGSFHFGHDR